MKDIQAAERGCEEVAMENKQKSDFLLNAVVRRHFCLLMNIPVGPLLGIVRKKPTCHLIMLT